MLSIGSRRRGVLDVSASTCDVYVCGKDRLVRAHGAKASSTRLLQPQLLDASFDVSDDFWLKPATEQEELVVQHLLSLGLSEAHLGRALTVPYEVLEVQVSANGTLMALVGLQRVALMRLPPPWQPPGAAADANDVAELFEGLGLGQYAAGARDLGYDLPTLRRLSGVEQQRMAEELRMKPGHSLKLTMCAPTPGPRRAAPPASAKAPPRATPPSCRAAPTAPPLTPLPPRAQGARRADAGARARARGAR